MSVASRSGSPEVPKSQMARRSLQQAGVDTTSERSSFVMEMSSNSECFGCGRSGHWVKHCPNASGARGRELFCYRCGDQGHMARDCDQTEDGVCGEIGHVAVHCSKASETNCYNCGKAGHLAKECTIEATA
ncbi:hypothetical protein CCH79_00006636 [Gambusia affinis]|uniref:CCHC-type domain-containing protein n=1 Tax=Gambusia affinis TaxID=33528 RepID=A0A315W8M5_GAMAF|nr:hypothetical protein CCH79_00006636 [Gambusia affinis]